MKMFIRCAVCNKSVDKIFGTHDEHRNEWRVRVHCHGATDECTIDNTFIYLVPPGEMMKGTVFDGPYPTKVEIRPIAKLR